MMPEALEKTGGDAKPNHRRARLVNKRLSSADAILSRVIVKRDREAKSNAMISDVSIDLIDEFILEESWKIARRLATVHTFKGDSECIAIGSQCKLCNAISGAEYVIELDRQLTGRKLYQLARRALGLLPSADSTSILLTLEGVEVQSNDCLCYNRFRGKLIQFVLHK